MIAALRGRIVAFEDDRAILDVGGVGYEVFCHVRTQAALHEQRGTEVTLRIHTAVSDDAIRLFGFLSPEELRLFRLLIGVERIGPKVALGILGRAELPAMVRAIRGGDVALVATVPGIGRRTAERVILELRDRLDGLSLPGEAPATAAGSPALEGAVGALVSLGFREPQARAAVGEVLGDGDVAADDTTGLIGAALRRLDRVPA